MWKSVVCSATKQFVFIVCMIEVVCCELPSQQVSAMTSIYEIIENDTNPYFMWNNVLKNSSPCSWKGVVCSPDNSSIINISFTSSSISTSDFLPFLCNITSLESLDVSKNRLSSIPDGFFTGCGKMSGLKVLNFRGNMLNDSLPSLNEFTMLEILDFSDNSLYGEISLQLDGLGSLRSLDLGWNFFSGRIPTNLGKMNLLVELVLSGNIFSGEIPVEITKYRNLRVVRLRYNEHLSGSIPGELGELTRLDTLDLSENNLTGGIPASFSKITTLRRFEASFNHLNGTIPSGIASHLQYLDLSHNMLTGTIPSGIASHLQFLDLSHNMLTGTIPSHLLSRLYLQTLNLSFNELEGPIPAINSTKLQGLKLGSNDLSGTFPLLGNHLGLMYLELENNRLTGNLPPTLGNLTNLEVLNLEVNSFVGAIPPQISQLKLLGELNFGMNSLNGTIPSSISRLEKLRKLDLQGNNLCGPIPDSIGNLSSLDELHLGNNRLSGRIPDMPETLQFALNLSYNLFDGLIPTSLSKLYRLESLDLSNNRFSGEIPEFLAGLDRLNQLLLMNNELSGVVPNFGSYVKVGIGGNNGLIVLRKDPISAALLQRNKISIGSDFVIAFASGIPVGLLISVIAIFVSRRYNKIHGHLSPPNSIHRPNIDFKRAMEAVADPSNITVKTTFSTFYKAVMPSGTTYLVKKVNHSNMLLQFPRHEQLVEELEVVGNLSNSNVMIPVAYELTVRRAYLFYDFVRGTLYDILHHRKGSTLEWSSRYNIAVGVAKGLAYLHECTSGPIILLNLSSKSILLKSVDEPHISDIELCNLIHPSKTRGTLFTAADSAGYAPPEYACTQKVTAAGNVYSFGVVLLELVTGKPAVSGGTELANWVSRSSEQRNKWDEILDSSVSETSIAVRDQMLAVLEVAIACICISPEMRPNTVTLVQMLLSRRSHN